MGWCSIDIVPRFAEKYEKMIRSPNVVAKSDGDEVFHVITLFIFLIFMNLLLAVVASHYQKMKVKSNVAYEDYITNALQTHVKRAVVGALAQFEVIDNWTKIYASSCKPY